MVNETKLRIVGILLAIVGASFWGLGGTVSDFLFQQRDIDINWYVTARLLISGFVLLMIYKIINRQSSLFDIFKNKHSLFQLFIFQFLVCCSFNTLIWRLSISVIQQSLLYSNI